MKRIWSGAILALALAVTLTGCMGRGGNSGSPNGQTGGSAMRPDVSGSGNVSQDIGAADDRLNENTPGENGTVNGPVGSSANSGTDIGRTSYAGTNGRLQRRMDERRGDENAFMKDGRYRANSNGKLDGRINPSARDFTQNARDMLRDAGKAVGDAGRSIGGAAADVGRSVTGSARGAMGR